jgi:hypothetical protein
MFWRVEDLDRNRARRVALCLAAIFAVTVWSMGIMSAEAAAGALPIGYSVDVDESGTTTSESLGGSGSLAATGQGNVNYGWARECAPSVDGGPFSTGQYPPETCAQLGRPYNFSGSPEQPSGFWFTGNQNCVNAGRPFSGSSLTWHVQLPQAGYWHVEVYIPSWTSYGWGDRYTLTSADGQFENYPLIQQAYHGQWVSLFGSHRFMASQDYTVALGLADGSDSYCHYQMADQMKWVYDGSLHSQVNMTPSNDPTHYGDEVIFDTVVAPAEGGGGVTPTGTVTFREGSTVLATQALDSTGSAAWLETGLSAGTHEITVAYSGDAVYESSVSPPVLETIERTGTTTLALSTRNPAYYGEWVTFVASVLANEGANTPTGTLTMTDNLTQLGTFPLDEGGQVVFQSLSLPPGNDEITFAYPGDANYEPSGTTLKQVVYGGAPEAGKCDRVVSAGTYGTANCTSPASGGKYVWTPFTVESKASFSLAAGMSILETVGKRRIVCKTAGGSGAYPVSKRMALVLHLSGCELNSQRCESEGASDGEISIGLAGIFGWQNKTKELRTTNVAVELASYTHGPIVAFSCGATAVSIRGAVLADVAKDKASLTTAIKFAATKGRQKPESFEGGPRAVLEASFAGGVYEQIGLTMSKSALTSSLPIEINAFA